MPTIKIGIFAPDIRSAPISGLSIVDRAKMVAEKIALWSASYQVFLAPEYLFARDIDKLPGYCTPISYDEAQQVRDIMKAASLRAQGMLIVPGTIFFMNGTYNPHAFNVAFAYLDGKEIKEVSKTGDAQDIAYARKAGFAYFATPPDEATAVLTWRGIKVCMQICADITIEPPEVCKLALHPAFMPGAALLHAAGQKNAPENRAIADGSGKCKGLGASAAFEMKGADGEMTLEIP
jgi:hypothetical protein